MKLTDRRLYQALTFQDFRFRLFYEENHRSQDVLQRAVARALIEPNYFVVWGTDHSDWDGNVNFQVTKSLGSRFVFIKAMEGTVPSRLYIPNTLRAKEVGLLDAPYHWLHQHAKVNCKLQAQQVWERTKPYVTKLPLMVDFEWTRYMNQPANPTYADLDIWVTEYTRISGIKPLYYSAAGYMNELGRMPADLRRKFSGFVVASYGGGAPIMPIGFGPTDYEFHQFAAEGNAALISPNDAGKKEVDLLNSILTPVQFDQKYGTVGPIPTEPEEPMPGEIQIGTIDTSERYIRNGPGVSNQHIATLYRGDKVMIDDERDVQGFKWYHIVDARRGRVDGQKVITMGGLNVDQRNDCWIYGPNVLLDLPTPPPSNDKVPFSLNVTGFKTFTGELEKDA